MLKLLSMPAQTYLFAIFGCVVVGFLVLDLGFFNRKSHKVETKAALWQSIFWIMISVAFGYLVFRFIGPTAGAEFMSAYVTEKMLSVDNLFVIMLIFNYFKLEERYHHRALFWGIIGAIFLRAAFIGAGTLIVTKFDWVLYVFGVILIYTGLKLLKGKGEEHVDFEKNKVIKIARRYLPFTVSPHNGKFFVMEKGKLLFTSLFMVVLLVEATDVVFAVDSIPAAFAISQNFFIVFTSNIFAIMGLRALFFLIESVLFRFHRLQDGLAFVLLFIGAKMLSGLVGLHMSSFWSLIIIVSALIISMALSVALPKKIK